MTDEKEQRTANNKRCVAPAGPTMKRMLNPSFFRADISTVAVS